MRILKYEHNMLISEYTLKYRLMENKVVYNYLVSL